MDFNTFINKFPIKLNTQQREAVQAVNGPVLLLAVPGSGKTTVLVARLGYMIYCCGIDPSKILVLTYTVAATNDMRERFIKLFGEELVKRLRFKTINSVSLGIIKAYGKKINKQAFELESDEKKLLHIISQMYQKYEKSYPDDSDLNNIKTLITYIKNMMLSDEEVENLEKTAGCRLLDIYNGYCNELKKQGLMDYDDQMLYALKILKSDPGFLRYCQSCYPYICVDEAQDTSRIQHEIIALLSAETENLFMVGDEDQSIYGFRAAYPEALLSFEKNHPDARVLLMEDNFRSNANIVKAADSFIQKNQFRHKKHMKPTREATSEIKEIRLKGREAQYEYLLKLAEECTEQTAVLYRDNESIIPLIDMLERKGIPYRVRNAELSFFSNRMVTDIQDILNFSKDMTNTELFEKIYYKISTYLSKQAAQDICSLSRQKGSTVFDEAYMYGGIKPGTLKSMMLLEKELEALRLDTPRRAINRILDHMNYSEYMVKTGLRESKLFILKSIAEKETTIEGFLNRLAELRQIIQNKENDRSCRFILSTIHGSKGLEYDNVYMIDLIDGIFPENVPASYERADKEEISLYEEERRLFYVGATRARNNLYLLNACNRAPFIEQFLYMEMLKPGNAVSHKHFGKGTVVDSNDSIVRIKFENEEKSLNLRVLIEKELLYFL